MLRPQHQHVLPQEVQRDPRADGRHGQLGIVELVHQHDGRLWVYTKGAPEADASKVVEGIYRGGIAGARKAVGG